MSWPYSKYHNKWTDYNGVKYQSQKEAMYAQELDLRQRAKEIVSWNRQIKMPIEVNGKYICNYLCDFEVLYPNGKVEYIDVKGMRTGAPYQMFKLKKKLVESIYNVKILEV